MLWFVLALGAPARAEEPPASPLEFHLAIDTPLIAVFGAGWVAGEIVQFAAPVPGHPPCSPCLAGDIGNSWDRGLAGRHDATGDWISTGGVVLALVGPLVADAVDVHWQRLPWRGLTTDSLLFAEAVLIDGAINQAVKLATQRPRPFVYGLGPGDPALGSSESYVSFYSEHASLAFTAAGFYTTLFALRHPRSRGAAAAVGVIAFTVASGIAALRVEAGKHFYTDVLAGALAGTAIGVTVPLLHHKRIRLPVAVAPLPGGGVIATLGFNY